LQGLKNWGRREGDVWEGGTVQLSKQGIPSFGQKHSGHEFLEIYKASAFRLFVPPLKNSAENEDLPSAQFSLWQANASQNLV
jgi:hypothetical protein